MRDFLDEILEFIGSESLTDEEFEAIQDDIENAAIDKETYEALRATLEARENVSVQVTKLQKYFEAGGVDLSDADAIPTPQSKIFIGGQL